MSPDVLRDADTLDLFAIVRAYLDPEAADEFAEIERRFWRAVIGEMAANEGLSLRAWFARRLGEAA